MSQITDEILSRKAVLKAEEDAKVAKLELHKTMLKGATDPFLEILKSLDKDGWYAENVNFKLTMCSPSSHMQDTWQSIGTPSRKDFDAHFHVGKDGLVVKFDSKLITLNDLREKMLDHIAKYYVKKERARS